VALFGGRRRVAAPAHTPTAWPPTARPSAPATDTGSVPGRPNPVQSPAPGGNADTLAGETSPTPYRATNPGLAPTGTVVTPAGPLPTGVTTGNTVITRTRSGA
jgi:hypothetical protein